MKRKKIPYGTKLPVKLTLRERDLIRDETFCEPDFAKFSVVEGKGITVNMSLDDIEEVQGYIAAEANHTGNRKLQKELDRLFGKLQVYLDTYDDQAESQKNCTYPAGRSIYKRRQGEMGENTKSGTGSNSGQRILC
jgi:hypothetical protein